MGTADVRKIKPGIEPIICTFNIEAETARDLQKSICTTALNFLMNTPIYNQDKLHLPEKQRLLRNIPEWRRRRRPGGRSSGPRCMLPTTVPKQKAHFIKDSHHDKTIQEFCGCASGAVIAHCTEHCLLHADHAMHLLVMRPADWATGRPSVLQGQHAISNDAGATTGMPSRFMHGRLTV